MIKGVKILTQDGFQAVVKFTDYKALFYFSQKVQKVLDLKSIRLINLSPPYHPIHNLNQLILKETNSCCPSQEDITIAETRDWNLHIDRNTEDTRVRG